MKKILIKGITLIVVFILGSYLIATYAPWQDKIMQGFELNFVLQFFLFAFLGFILKTESFKRKKWDKKLDLCAIAIIAVALVITIVLSWNWLAPQMAFGSIHWTKFAYIFVGSGIIFFLPLLIGFETSRLLFK